MFKFFEDYVASVREAFELAEANGEPEPDRIPHPSDVILDCDNREVRVLGLRNAEEAERCGTDRAKLELFFEEAKLGMPSDDHPVYGAFTFLFATMAPMLPPRLRSIDEAFSDTVFRRAMGMHKDWITYLNQQLKAVGLDYDVSKMLRSTIDLRELNLRPGRYGFEHYRWTNRKSSN